MKKGLFIIWIILFSANVNGPAQSNDAFQPYQECHASFKYVVDSLNPLQVKFFDQSTGQITSYLWNFGDPASGANNTSTLKDSEHIFSSPGNYIVCLVIANNDSGFFCTDDTCLTVTVHYPVPCHADFYAIIDTSEPASHTVQFYDLSTGDPDHWLWDFGDGFTSDHQNPQHSYSTGGTYTVCLKIRHVTGGNYSVDSTCKEIPVFRYLELGGHLFAGPSPINNPISTGDTGIVYLIRVNNEQSHLVDSNNFVYLGYYTFPHLQEGNYTIRAALTRGSARYHQYVPTYYGDVTELYQAELIHLSDSDVFSATIHLHSVNPGINDHGQVNGRYAGEIYPNPGNGDTRVGIETSCKELIRIFVVSSTGENIYSKLFDLSPGQNLIVIPSASFPAGIYYITSVLDNGTILKSWKFLKFY